MVRSVTVNVTKRDIDNGECGNGHKCAIALALSRATRRKYVSVGGATCSLLNRDGLVQVAGRLPMVAQLFIADFDSGREVTPFKFQVELA